MNGILALFLLASPALAEQPWWQDLGDPGLQAVIDEGLSNNGDLEAAWERVAASEALARQAWSPLLPSASATFQHSVSRRDAVGRGFGVSFGQPDPDAPKGYNSGQYGLQAQWNVDLFGRSYAAMRASRLDAQAAAGDRDAAAASLAVRIASTWYDLVAVEQRIDIVRAQLATQERVLEVTELRFEGADATGLDVLQQRQQLATVRTLLPPLVATQQVLQQQLAVLLGRDPLQADLPDRPTALPELPPLDMAVPEDLLQRRPDLLANDKRVDAAGARRYSTLAGGLPAVSASASTQTQYNDLNEDYEITEFDTWQVGVAATVPIFNGGRVFEGYRASRAQKLAAERTLEQSQLVARAEITGALAREEQQRAYVSAVQDQVDAAVLTSEQARSRYRTGNAQYLQVLTSTNNELSAQLNAVSAQRDLLAIHIDLHDALGGSWTSDLGERASR